MRFPIRHSICLVTYFALVLLLITGCGRSTERPKVSTTVARELSSTDEIDRLVEARQRTSDQSLRNKYAWLHELVGPQNADETQNKLPFTKVQLERTTCFGTCPAYTVTLHRDGRAVYEGREYAKRKGRYVGTVHLSSFGRLCCFIEMIRFDKFDAEYMTPATDLPSTLVTVESGTHSKTVTDYGIEAPVDLWVLETLIDSIAEQIEWRAEE